MSPYAKPPRKLPTGPLERRDLGGLEPQERRRYLARVLFRSNPRLETTRPLIERFRKEVGGNASDFMAELAGLAHRQAQKEKAVEILHAAGVGEADLLRHHDSPMGLDKEDVARVFKRIGLEEKRIAAAFQQTNHSPQEMAHILKYGGFDHVSVAEALRSTGLQFPDIIQAMHRLEYSYSHITEAMRDLGCSYQVIAQELYTQGLRRRVYSEEELARQIGRAIGKISKMRNEKPPGK